MEVQIDENRHLEGSLGRLGGAVGVWWAVWRNDVPDVSKKPARGLPP